MTKVMLSALLILLLASSAHAASGQHFWYLDLSGSAGYNKVDVNNTPKPTLGEFGGGITAGFTFGRFLLGATSDYRSINQYSDDSDSNFKGTRWNIISPTVGVTLGWWIIKADVQLLGDYKLSEKTAATSGSDVSYTKPLGFRAVALYPIFSRFHLGPFFEYVTYGTQHVVAADGTVTDTTLNPKLKTWQAGLTGALVF